MWDSNIFPRQLSQIQVSDILSSTICVGIPRTGNNVKTLIINSLQKFVHATLYQLLLSQLSYKNFNSQSTPGIVKYLKIL